MIWRGTALTRPAPVACAWPGQPRRRMGREPHVGVDEQEVRAARGFGQVVAGMDLAGPAFRQGRRGEKADARVARGEARTISAVRVRRAVVHDQDLDRHAHAGEAASTAAPIFFASLRAGIRIETSTSPCGA